MQLKIRRSQRDGGVISKTAIFCLDARVEFTGEEKRHITRYKLGKEVIYSSEAARRHSEKGDAHLGSGTVGNLKALGSFVMARINLNVSINSLQQGQHIECKSLEELIEAEDAIMMACQNLKSYLDVASTFDGREVLFDFSTGAPEAVAKAIAPSPALILEPSSQPSESFPLPASADKIIYEPQVVEALPAAEYDTALGESNEVEDIAYAEQFDANDVDESGHVSDVTIEDGAKKALMLVCAIIALFLIIKMLIG